jgi:hypothetical protein
LGGKVESVQGLDEGEAGHPDPHLGPFVVFSGHLFRDDILQELPMGPLSFTRYRIAFHFEDKRTGTLDDPSLPPHVFSPFGRLKPFFQKIIGNTLFFV